jgi:hypothetical protein
MGPQRPKADMPESAKTGPRTIGTSTSTEDRHTMRALAVGSKRRGPNASKKALNAVTKSPNTPSARTQHLKAQNPKGRNLTGKEDARTPQRVEPPRMNPTPKSWAPKIGCLEAPKGQYMITPITHTPKHSTRTRSTQATTAHVALHPRDMRPTRRNSGPTTRRPESRRPEPAPRAPHPTHRS